MENSLIYYLAYYIVPIASSLFLIYLCFDFMGKLERNIYKSKINYILAYIVYIILLFIAPLTRLPVFSLAVTILGIPVIGRMLYNSSNLYTLYYFVFSLCLFFLELLLSLGINYLLIISNVIIPTTEELATYQIVAVLITRIIEFMFIKLFTIFISKRKKSNLSLSQSLSSLIVPIFSIIYITSITYYLQLYIGETEILILVINVLSIFILNIYFTKVFDTINKNNVLQNEINLYNQQKKMQYDYYINLEEKYKTSRKLAHDIRNHLHSIEELYNLNEIEASKKYTSDIHSILNNFNQKYYTDNRVLNIILNDKLYKIKDSEINVDLKIRDTNLNFIEDIDITTIFANLLDNALESCTTIKDPSFIKLHMNTFNDLLVINITNSISTKPIKVKNKFKSSKLGHSGLGLENIKKSLEKYEGDMNIEFDENEFKVNIVIPTNIDINKI